MIEPDVETLQRWKRFHLSTLRVRVADGTDLTRLVRELLLMTTRARRVCILAGPGRLRGVALATMTKQTWQARVHRIVVFELRIIRLRNEPRRAGAGRKNYERNEK
jgi:hypothetical protein